MINLSYKNYLQNFANAINKTFFLAIEIPTDLKLDDDKDDLLEKALHKARKIKQKENLITDIMKTEIKEESEEQVDTGNIVLNATAEFCRTLGKMRLEIW